MKKVRHWLYEHFLPVWLKADLLKENERLGKEVQEQQIHIRELNAYIDGLELALRCQHRIIINNHTKPGASGNKSPEEVRT